MRPLLKMGDIRNLHDARYCSAVGISLLGFNMGKEKSMLQSPQEVKDILSWLSGPEAVGEFFYEKPSMVAGAAAVSGVHRISIPADYRPEEAAGLPLPLIFRVESQNHLIRIGHLAGLFPSALFEMVNKLAMALRPEDRGLIFPRTLLIAENPDSVWSIARKKGELPYGFTLEGFISNAEGGLDYEKCDGFLEQLETLIPA